MAIPEFCEMNISIKNTARLAGLIYLIVILGGIFAELMVRGKLVVTGDPAATVRNIMAHETLYRWGFAVEIFYCTLNVPLILIFYRLFNPVNRNLTFLVVVFSAIGTAVEALSLLFHFAPLILLSNKPYLSAFTTAQLQGWSYLSLRFFEYGFCISLVFFGGYCLSMGTLIYRSGFLPKFIGILLGFQGLCYLINSFANFLSPHLATQFFPVLEVAGLGEVSFCLWLLIAGIYTKKV
jgi:Domain of unknown function (DUF4386)